MKRPWAVLLIAALAGCRSSQPATNPFLRTTVPPPATGQGMMVMPGETPPVVVTPGTPGAAPSAVTPGVPVTPAQPAPIIAPPPPAPQKEFQPPGGSYLYHQSSNERPRANPTTASGNELAAVRQASHVEPASAASTPAAGATLAFHARSSADEGRGDPPEPAASITVGRAAGGNRIRIVGDSAARDAEDATETSVQSVTGAPVFRMTVGGNSPAPEAHTASTSRIAIVAP